MIIVKFNKFEVLQTPRVVELLNSNLSKFYPSPCDYDKLAKDFCLFEHQLAICGTINSFVVSFGVIVFEKKIRGGLSAHIEDIVVDPKFQGQGIGKKTIEHLLSEARKADCYKVSLMCKENNLTFYEKCGFHLDGLTMQKIF